jgi:hypothetical protein
MNKNLKRTRNCSVRVREVAEPLGFKTLGSFYKFLKGCQPTAKLYHGLTHVRAAQALKWVEQELKTAY